MKGRLENLLKQLETKENGVTGTVCNLGGAIPELVLQGNSPEEVEKALKLVQMAFSEAVKQSHLVIITVSLRELTDSEIKSIGLNLVPSISGIIQRDYGRDYTYEPPNPEDDPPPPSPYDGRNSSQASLI